MTNEEIEAVNTELLDIVVSLPLESARHRAYELIDALCAAARQPESLVGKRVRVYMHYAGTVTSDARFAVEYHDAAGNEFSKLLSRDDFEFLEDTDATIR